MYTTLSEVIIGFKTKPGSYSYQITLSQSSWVAITSPAWPLQLGNMKEMGSSVHHTLEVITGFKTESYYSCSYQNNHASYHSTILAAAAGGLGNMKEMGSSVHHTLRSYH